MEFLASLSQSVGRHLLPFQLVHVHQASIIQGLYVRLVHPISAPTNQYNNWRL